MKGHFNKPILAIIAVSSMLLLSGMYAYGVTGNTTVVNIGVSPTTGFIEVEVSDPDGLDRVELERSALILLCAPTTTTSVILEFIPANFPATVTVADCNGKGGDDVTVWLIESTGITCIEGSCLGVDDPEDKDPEDPQEETKCDECERKLAEDTAENRVKLQKCLADAPDADKEKECTDKDIEETAKAAEEFNKCNEENACGLPPI